MSLVGGCVKNHEETRCCAGFSFNFHPNSDGILTEAGANFFLFERRENFALEEAVFHVFVVLGPTGRVALQTIGMQSALTIPSSSRRG
ncbi:hypothetical protein L596_027450 [Steinernema carpocapsae]|uniref:Uncharacterized protein n=1 Tax=Steinernema carpocapsae TaxID=34508 RepID=A0A4U5LVF8_STECR|nr:hypothetical protein L596_027450 [Steinernema carpocapsae]